ncbi:competence/damage-inducible protein A [Prosthecobacter sp.]|uniref:competence/damage-inducible protein A n=1 Tax=Prosthecobacter sp. TaxID=1965333 RepID=UPI002ABB37F2|nr:competence/damage-inducible protein A [Prosthecobacter sp.]MDZ4404937.1 competence/damage-inducible protein A [Prosthecobacter sp.]
MKVELVNTGTELLLGDTINTNAAWIGQRLAALGIQVTRQTIVPDGAVIRVAIAEAAQRSDVVLVSGGLGPTNDDLTRESTAELLSLEMELNDGVMQHLNEYFAKRSKPVSEATKRQAMVPRGAVVMPNLFGTAPGLYFPAELGAPLGWNTHIFLLPGPPRELKPMVENEVETRLREWLPDGGSRRVLYLKITGVGESDIVEAVEKQLEAITGLDLGYCIRNGDVDVRLAGSQSAVDEAAVIVRAALGDCIVSEDRRIIEEVIVQLLTERGEWLATAESCTGGTIASRVTDVSGSSRVFGHGWVTYANEAKQQHLGVPAELIETHGAVSEEVACAMAEGALKKSGADHAISVTGIAGPTGGTPEKPVGTVWIALASRNAETWAQKRFSPGARDRFKLLTSQAALEMLRRRLMGVALRA